MKVSLIGPYPPPYGGVSLHVARLEEYLESHGTTCVKDFSSARKEGAGSLAMLNRKRKILQWLLGQLLLQSEDIVHCHDIGPALQSIPSLISIRRKAVVISLHSFRYDTQNMRLLDRLFFWLCKQKHVYFMAASKQIKHRLVSIGINDEYIEVVPGFIPPFIKREEINEIPSEVWSFIDKHSPVITANASKLWFYNGEDMYGIDMCIKLCAGLKLRYPNIGLVFGLSEANDQVYFNKLKQLIAEESLQQHFLFQTMPCQFYPVIMKSHLFVRPTNSDGDAMSLREALYFHVPSVTSDIAPRPASAVLFKNRDVADFICKVKDVLDNYELYKKRLDNMQFEDNVKKIISIYKRSLERD